LPNDCRTALFVLVLVLKPFGVIENSG